MKKKLLMTAQVIEYVFTFIYAVVTALFYSVGETIYWLFFGLALLSLCLGLYTQSIIARLGQKKSSDRIILIVITVLSLIACPACLFNLLAAIDKGNDKYVVSVNPEYKERTPGPKKWYKKANKYINEENKKRTLKCKTNYNMNDNYDILLISFCNNCSSYVICSYN